MVANTPRAEQACDQIFGANLKLFGEIFDADAFRNGDAARDRLRLIRQRQSRRRGVALHRAFLHSTRNVTLAGPARRCAGTSAGTCRTGRRQARANAKGTRAGGRLPRGMHGTAFAGTSGGRGAVARGTADGDAEKLAVPELDVPGAGRSGPMATPGATAAGADRPGSAPCKQGAVQSAERSFAAELRRWRDCRRARRAADGALPARLMRGNGAWRCRQIAGGTRCRLARADAAMEALRRNRCDGGAGTDRGGLAVVRDTNFGRRTTLGAVGAGAGRPESADAETVRQLGFAGGGTAGALERGVALAAEPSAAAC